jgi:hypothetical protein
MAPTFISNFTPPVSSLISFFFYAVRVVSKESRRLVLPRISFSLWYLCYLPVDLLNQRRPEAHVSNLMPVPLSNGVF